ncbi:MAG: extracellular solute-binding protein [Verrucomicrobia bacterium]|nr:extracellular solute-binding protein [Verrucomicrobiota bacterium]
MRIKNSANAFSRREFLKIAGAGGALISAGGLCSAYAQSSGIDNNVQGSLVIFDFGSAKAQQDYKEAIGRFNKKFPNVRVKDDYAPFPKSWSQYINQLQTHIAAGLAPDVVAIAIEGVRLTVKNDLMLPLDDIISSDPEAKEALSDTAPALTSALKVNGKTYYLTREFNNMCIHYNTKMFADAGIDQPKKDWTWDDFLAVAQKLTKGESGNKTFGFGVPFFNFGLQPWFLTNSTSPLSPDWSKSNLDDPRVLESVKFIHSLINEHKVSPSVAGADFSNGAAMLAGGRLAMTGGGHWLLGTYLSNNFKDIDVQYWPRKTASTSVFGSGGWGITKHCKNPKLAWELIKELNSLQTQEAIGSIGDAVPGRKAATQIPQFEKFPKNSTIFYECLRDAKPVPSPANYTEMEDIFMRHMQQIMSNAVTPEQGLEQAHKELAAAMARVAA